MLMYKMQTNRVVRSFLLLFLTATGLLFSQSGHAQQKPSTFTARLINIENAANSTFSYNTSLYNGSKQSHVYNLYAQAPDGWSVSFTVYGSQVTSFRLDSLKSQDITVQINPSSFAKPQKYEIPVTAISDNNDTLNLTLEAVVKGAYDLQLSTPTGRLSDEVTEGSDKQIQLVVTNPGTIALKDITMSAQTPANWTATFDSSRIASLEPGKSITVTATLKVPDKTIAGDYVTTFTANNSNKKADAAFRMTVRTSALSGWFGILVILIATGIIYYLIRKYGRR